MLLFSKHRFRILLHMQGSYNRMVHVCRGPCSMIHRCCLLSLSTGQLQKMARVNIIPHTACWGPLLVVPIDCSQRLLVCGIRGLHAGLYLKGMFIISGCAFGMYYGFLLFLDMGSLLTFPRSVVPSSASKRVIPTEAGASGLYPNRTVGGLITERSGTFSGMFGNWELYAFTSSHP